ncbi:MAG: GHKL domain-containing protein, partial [Clostridia bacterium]|nr:GHKL domain-containing protein [Clostridia bacterium]
GLLLLGVAAGKPDWKLLALIVALVVLTARDMMVHLGHYFLPEPLLDALAGGLMLLVPPAAMLVYLTLNRRRDFWRLLGRVSAWAGGVLTAAYLVSLAHGGRMATLVNTVVLELFRYGVWEPAAYWLSVYLVGACAGLALWGHIRSIAEVRAEAQTLALKTELAMQSSHAMEQSSRKTAELRHELKNHVAAMNALYAKGDTQGLAQYLSELDKLQTALMPARYTEHFLVNAILQNAAATAAENGVRFEVHANVPEDIGVEERDLSALLMNMLDNALEAVRRVEPESARFIRVSAEQKNGFFAISCKNTYAPPLKTDERGRLITTKADASAHGFGMKQMRAVAEKYHSILDVSYTGDVFTVQTALKTKQ